ncbi:hypothetical protein DRE_03541 [Drechslerella stenobrocha 248]|uniref:EXPERA domain-containing protein n=1 Tax=Drechslerella stenobrocha 248 TaxID=1043628 RepID=W7I420_9PEZI|nr:hypothetical protein DRE_03541 [Drechslerella stenobrocha 248]
MAEYRSMQPGFGWDHEAWRSCRVAGKMVEGVSQSRKQTAEMAARADLSSRPTRTRSRTPFRRNGGGSPSVLEAIDTITIVSLVFVLGLLIIAYFVSLSALPPAATNTIRFIFIWHLFDALTHLTLEGSFLYHSFFSFSTTPSGLKLYGADFSSAPMAKIWQEYSKADTRWGVADPVVVAIELPTVLLEGPGAAYICYLLAKEKQQVWFWILVVAVGEIYGGWMTFAPEWLTGSPALDTSNWMYLWLYLFFFNTLWVFIPGWLCWESYRRIVGGLNTANGQLADRKRR